jgi:uncharacterized protein with GYD domain
MDVGEDPGTGKGSARVGPRGLVEGRRTMQTFVLMTKLSPELQRPGKRKEVGQEWKLAVEKACPEVRWLAHYAVLGPYDFMDIYEAPDPEAAAKVALITQASGALKAESWTVIPYGRYLEIAREVSELTGE